jgi:hypothetical protein
VAAAKGGRVLSRQRLCQATSTWVRVTGDDLTDGEREAVIYALKAEISRDRYAHSPRLAPDRRWRSSTPPRCRSPYQSELRCQRRQHGSVVAIEPVVRTTSVARETSPRGAHKSTPRDLVSLGSHGRSAIAGRHSPRYRARRRPCRPQLLQATSSIFMPRARIAPR